MGENNEGSNNLAMANLAITNERDDLQFQVEQMEGILEDYQQDERAGVQPLFPDLNQQRNQDQVNEAARGGQAGINAGGRAQGVGVNAGGRAQGAGVNAGGQAQRNPPPENVPNHGRRGVRAGQNRRRFKRHLNPYERDLKNAADFFINMVHSSTARTRENLEKEREWRARQEAED